MSTFLERLQIEQQELEDKLTKLIDYIDNNEHFKKLSNDNISLLIKQRVFMYEYNNILLERIKINS